MQVTSRLQNWAQRGSTVFHSTTSSAVPTSPWGGSTDVVQCRARLGLRYLVSGPYRRLETAALEVGGWYADPTLTAFERMGFRSGNRLPSTSILTVCGF
jgi:hypothetical protein